MVEHESDILNGNHEVATESFHTIIIILTNEIYEKFTEGNLSQEEFTHNYAVLVDWIKDGRDLLNIIGRNY